MLPGPFSLPLRTFPWVIPPVEAAPGCRMTRDPRGAAQAHPLPSRAPQAGKGTPPRRRGSAGKPAQALLGFRAPRRSAVRGLLRRLGRGCSRSVHDRHHVGARPCAMTLAFSMSPTQRQSVSGHCTAPLSNRSRAPSPGAPERVDRCGRILERAVRSRPRTAERRGARNPRSACAVFPAKPRRRAPAPAHDGVWSGEPSREPSSEGRKTPQRDDGFPACGAWLGRGCACAARRGSHVIRYPGAASTGGSGSGDADTVWSAKTSHTSMSDSRTRGRPPFRRKDCVPTRIPARMCFGLPVA